MTKWSLQHPGGPDDERGIVRNSTLNSREDREVYRDRAVTTTYGKHGLRRVFVEYADHSTIRYDWEGFRVPWIIWAMFS